MARARQLAATKASRAPLMRFLAGQSDVILMLCGGPVAWYVTQKRQRARARQRADDVAVRRSTACAVHQLRQVFTALLLGTELLARKASAGTAGDLGRVAQRLNKIVRDGLAALAVLGEPCPADLLDARGEPIRISAGVNGVRM